MTIKVNPELCKKALEVVKDPNLLVNLVSRRARQLRAGAGPLGRPLVPNTQNMSLEDIALKEIIEGKITYEFESGSTPEKPRSRRRG